MSHGEGREVKVENEIMWHVQKNADNRVTWLQTPCGAHTATQPQPVTDLLNMTICIFENSFYHTFEILITKHEIFVIRKRQQIISSLFWDVPQCRLIVSYRRFGTACRSHQGPDRSTRKVVNHNLRRVTFQRSEDLICTAEKA